MVLHLIHLLLTFYSFKKILLVYFTKQVKGDRKTDILWLALFSFMRAITQHHVEQDKEEITGMIQINKMYKAHGQRPQ